MRDIPLLAAIAVCGSCGAVVRYLVSVWASQWPGFPFATLLVNVAGCFLLSALAYSSLADQSFMTPQLRAALGTGFLGALTTFSTFGVETFQRIERNQWSLALINIAANIGLGLIAIWVGRQFVQWMLSS